MSKHTKQRWLECNDYGKELFVDELLTLNADLLAALEGLWRNLIAYDETPDDVIAHRLGLQVEVVAQARAAIATAKGTG